MDKKVILFDLDGTLVDTLLDLATAVNHALKEYNYDTVSVTHVRNSIGDGVETLIKRCIPNGIENKDYLNVLDAFRSYYSEHYLRYTFPFGGVKETLLALKGSGFILGVVTNKIDSIAVKIVDKFFFGIFDVIVGARSTRRKKPHPETVNIALKTLNITNLDEVIYIGDTEVDYKTAVNSNIDVIFVSYGYRDKKFLQNIDESVKIVDDISEIRKIFLK
jgi:phosphoglycolate phosphatase